MQKIQTLKSEFYSKSFMLWEAGTDVTIKKYFRKKNWRKIGLLRSNCFLKNLITPIFSLKIGKNRRK
jgi:hypothetical protein